LLLATAIAAAANPADIVAEYRDGRVERRDLESWRRYLGHEGGRVPVRADIEELVLVRVLASRFDAVGPVAEYERRRRLLALDLAESALRSRLAAETHARTAEVAAALESDPGSKPQPRRYALENILKRCAPGCPEAERDSLRRRLEELKSRVLDGEDFAALARQESESESRLRGGQTGYVALERLAPAVAAAVRGLKTGELAIVDTPAGPTLLRLSGILEPEAPDLEALRRRLEVRLVSRKVDAAWDESSRALVAALRLEVRDTPRGAGLETVVASYRLPANGEVRNLTLAEFTTFLAQRGLPAPEDMSTPVQRREAVVQRALLDARHAEAAEKGLLTDDYARPLEWKSLELRAQMAANALADPPREPSTDELRAAYEKARDHYRHAPRWHLRALRLEIDPSKPASLYEDMRLLGDRARAGTLGFDAVADRLRPHARVQDLGWLTEAEIWRLGLNAENALRGLPAGASTPAVQESRELIILHVAEREEDRPLSFDEARPVVRAALLAERRREAGESLRRSIIAEQDVQVRE
jgi:hypothetical protein